MLIAPTSNIPMTTHRDQLLIIIIIYIYIIYFIVIILYL